MSNQEPTAKEKKAKEILTLAFYTCVIAVLLAYTFVFVSHILEGR